MSTDRPRPERPSPVAGEAVKWMVILLGVRLADLVRRFVVNDDAVAISVMMRIEAVRHSKCHYRHEKRRRRVTRSSAESSQHGRITVVLESIGYQPRCLCTEPTWRTGVSWHWPHWYLPPFRSGTGCQPSARQPSDSWAGA